MNDVHYKSNSNDWKTPKALFDYWNNIYHFDIDAAASKENALCERYYTQELDALKQDWHKDGKNFWLNPPYGRLIGKFIKKAYEESFKGCNVVCLIPSRTCTQYFHKYVMGASEIHFIKGRLKFINPSFPSYKEAELLKLVPLLSHRRLLYSTILNSLNMDGEYVLSTKTY